MTQSPHTPPPAYPAVKETSGKAVASLVVSIVAIFACMFLGILGIVLGHMARNEIRASGGRLGGAELATAGIIIGWIDVALSLVGLCFGVFFCLAFFVSAAAGAAS